MNIKRFPKIAGLIVVTLTLLSGCFGGGNTASLTENDRTRLIESQEYAFTLRIPREWDTITKKDFTPEVPPETDIVVRNNVKNEDFTANVSIVKKPLQQPRETLEYAKQVLNRQRTGLYNYKETKRDVMKIKIGDTETDTYITYFEAKKDPASPLIRFIQTYAVKDNSGYIVLGAFSPEENENNVKTVEEIVKSFTIK